MHLVKTDMAGKLGVLEITCWRFVSNYPLWGAQGLASCAQFESRWLSSAIDIVVMWWYRRAFSVLYLTVLLAALCYVWQAR